MSNCATCKWWDTDPAHRLGEGWGFCELTAEKEKPEHPHPRLAEAVDQFGMWPLLMTRHDFGCVQWTAKDE